MWLKRSLPPFKLANGKLWNKVNCLSPGFFSVKEQVDKHTSVSLANYQQMQCLPHSSHGGQQSFTLVMAMVTNPQTQLAFEPWEACDWDARPRARRSIGFILESAISMDMWWCCSGDFPLSCSKQCVGKKNRHPTERVLKKICSWNIHPSEVWKTLNSWKGKQSFQYISHYNASLVPSVTAAIHQS